MTAIRIVDHDIFGECILKIAQRDLILDVGGRYRFHKRLRGFKQAFADVRYYCLDIRRGSDLDVVGDLLALPFQSGVINGVICTAVLEHVREPRSAVRQIHRVLKPGGEAFVFAPFLHPYHGSPDEPDYWRFTLDGLLHLFRDFSEIQLQPTSTLAGTTLRFIAWLSPVCRVPMQRLASSLAKPLDRLAQWLGRSLGPMQATGYNMWLRK